MRQYEMAELCFQGPVPEGSQVQVNLNAVFAKDGKSTKVKGFYAGEGRYKVRFLPEEAGEYTYEVSGIVSGSGSLQIEPADEKHHGPVRADGIFLKYADGTRHSSFGTTVYALAHQSEALMNETFETLAKSPFNKVRMCLFPKHYNYNHNNPRYYAFAPSEAGKGNTYEAEEGSQVAGSSFADVSINNWDVHHPDFRFWEAFEDKILRLQELGIECDLILFHPYDRWGFASMPQADNLVYLDYLLRRFSAFPNVWWSLANEYDLCTAKSLSDWEEIEAFVAVNDPVHHMLSNHNCFQPWDWSRENVTHISWQTKQFARVGELARKYQKPVLFDECRYEGNVPESWGNISGKDMTSRFWKVMTQGGYCTHGETFYPGTEIAKENTATGESEVVWWARGGRLHGESPARIAFLREIVESLPGPLHPGASLMSSMLGLTDEQAEALLQQVPGDYRRFLSCLVAMEATERDKFIMAEPEYAGQVGEDEAFLSYKDTQCCAKASMMLPETSTYRVDVIDTWNMTRETVLTGVSGRVEVDLPGREYMAILAVKE